MCQGCQRKHRPVDARACIGSIARANHTSQARASGAEDIAGDENMRKGIVELEAQGADVVGQDCIVAVRQGGAKLIGPAHRLCKMR